jgi:hypothetical protein
MISDRIAYSLAQDELGWRWRVYDEAGEIIAAGRAKSQDAAELAIRQAIVTILCSGALDAAPAALGRRLEALSPAWDSSPLL